MLYIYIDILIYFLFESGYNNASIHTSSFKLIFISPFHSEIKNG